MKRESIRCDFCSAQIPAEDFDRGRAVVLLKKNYCTKCMAEAISRVKAADEPPSAEFQTPRPAPLDPPRRRKS